MRFRWHHNSPDGSLQTDQPESGTGVIDLSGVGCAFENASAPVLSGFSLQVQSGEFLSVLGSSGAGKTTALRVIAGFERVTAGYVRIGGRLVGSSFVHVPPDHRHVGLVFQDYALFPHLTVEKNVGFGLADLSGDARDRRVGEMIGMTGLEGLERRYVHELSGGQQQRVALARALAPNPVALLLDEPFSNLDRQLRSSLRREIRQIVKDAGVTTVLVTHDREEALAMADRVAAMGRGMIEQIGAPEEVYSRPVSADVARLIGPCELIPGVVRGDTVETEVGMFPINAAPGVFADGENVQALMRASELKLSPSTNGTDARVAFREFRGEFTEYGVRLPSGVMIRVRSRGNRPLEDGSQVAIEERSQTKITVYPAATSADET